MRSVEGIHRSSRFEAYGTGVASAATSTGGASSASRACSATWAMSVAPQLPAGGASWAHTNLLVRSIEPTMVSVSSGAIVRGSMTSTLIPSAAASLSRLEAPRAHHLGRHDGHVGALSARRRPCRAGRSGLVRPRHDLRTAPCARRRSPGRRSGSRCAADRMHQPGCRARQARAQARSGTSARSTASVGLRTPPRRQTPCGSSAAPSPVRPLM